MFKKPSVDVNVNTPDTIKHKISIDHATLFNLKQVVEDLADTAATVAILVIGVKATADIATHIVKTKIK